MNAAGSVGKPVKLTVKDTLSVVGGDAEFRATLTTADGKPISGAELVFVLNGKELGRNTTAADGLASRKHHIFPAAKMADNTIEVRFDGKPGNAEFNCASQTARLSILKAVTTLADLKYTYGEGFKISSQGVPWYGSTSLYFKGRLLYKTSGSESPVVGKTVSFSLDGKKATAVTDNSGQYNIKIDRNPANVGNKYQMEQLEYFFEEDSHFLGCYKKLEIKYYDSVSGAPPPFFAKTTIVQGFPFMLIAGRTTKIDAFLWYSDDKNKPVANTHIRLYAFKKNPLGKYAIEMPFTILLGEATTNAAGRATITYTYQGKANTGDTQDAETGGYDVVPAWVINNYGWVAYNASPATLILSQTYLTHEITSPATIKSGETAAVRVTLLRKYDKKPFAGAKIYLSPPIQLSGQNPALSQTTDKNGTAVFNMPITAGMGSGKKEFSVRLSTDTADYGDAPYKFEETRPIEILPAAGLAHVDIAVESGTAAYDEKKMLRASIKSGRLGIAGASLKFTVTNKDNHLLYDKTVVTGANGNAETLFNADYTPGPYRIEVDFNGINEKSGYLPAKGVGQLNLEKGYVPIKAAYDRTIDPNKLTGNIDTWEKSFGNHDEVAIKLGGKAYTAPLVGKGRFSLSVDSLAEGTQVAISYGGSIVLKPCKYTGVIQGGKIVGSSIETAN